jgi:hypothetical protein
VTIVDTDAAEAAVVRDNLGRLRAAGWGVQPARRDELVAEVGEHIKEALRAERAAGNQGEVVVRNVLERLGPPEDIVRAETEGQPYDVTGAPASGYAPVGGLAYQAGSPTATAASSVWGPVEIAAVLLLSIGSFVLPIVGPLVGIAFVWVSDRWTSPQKVIGSLLGLLPVLWLPLAIFGLNF